LPFPSSQRSWMPGFPVWLLGLVVLLLASCSTPQPAPPATAEAPAVEKEFPAVILNGDYPNPSIVWDGNDYYLTYASRNALPGLPIWHSRNLREWKMITRALQRYVGDVTAPEFVKHGELFYIYFTAGEKNWVVTSKAPVGPWSDPVDLKVQGSGPGHAVGEDGKRYLHFDGGMAVELAADGLSVIGQPEQVFQGWRFPEEWSTECFCLRSPKIVSRNGQYYLTASQGGSGGTPSGHMVISARSKSPLGPWEQSPYNPVIRTVRDEEPWWSKGIATIFDAGEGRWFAVYNAYRRNERKMGQQVIVEPITWTEEGWFHLTEPDKDQFRARTVRNHAIADDTFTSSELSLQWQLDASQFAPEYVLKDGQLLLPSQAKKLTVLYAQASDESFDMSVKLHPAGGVEAGLVLYFRPDSFVGIGPDAGHATQYVGGVADSKSRISCPACQFWRLSLRGNTLAMYYSEDGQVWKKHPRVIDISALHGDPMGGFHSMKPAIFVRGKGTLAIDEFTYTAIR
jgi:xylan 1,4-beta-xylosidase